MELSISDEKIPEPLTELEVALANAIMEGRKDEFVSEGEIFSILERTVEQTATKELS